MQEQSAAAGTRTESLELANVSRSIIACLAGTFVLRMAAAVMGNMIQLYLAKIDAEVEPLTFTVRGIITAVFFLPELFGSPILGAWSDRYGRKLFIMLGPLTGALAVQITALTTNIWLLAFTRLLEGLSTASAIPATLGYLSAITSEDQALRGRVMGFFEIATIGGTVAGLVLGGPLFDAFQNHAFTWNGLIYLASLGVFFFGMARLRPQVPAALAPQASSAWELVRTALHDAYLRIRAALTSPRILRFVPAWLAINMVLGLWFNHAIGQLVNTSDRFPDQLLFGLLENAAHPGTEVSLYGGVVFVIFAVGVVLWSLQLGRFKRTTIMLIGCGGLFALVVLLFLINHTDYASDPLIPVYVVLSALALMIVSGFTPAALTYLADVSEDDPVNRGAIMGLYTVLFGLGQFIGQLLGGPFADWLGFDGMILLTLLLAVFALATLVRLAQAEQPPPATS